MWIFFLKNWQTQVLYGAPDTPSFGNLIRTLAEVFILYVP